MLVNLWNMSKPPECIDSTAVIRVACFFSEFIIRWGVSAYILRINCSNPVESVRKAERREFVSKAGKEVSSQQKQMQAYGYFRYLWS